ncbi:conserved hypothetical protein [Crenothrix polyspora]|uniref:Uncharacterized protein n=1 Tax=Crenothrix polyspora TaxID=360316 RepID=A0A1R4HBJ5_9GAMM|nr:hypothetical protein [Crenothrix polyspora]SJM93634.1 conserved hypothetical protein [Crenothrix polyspora]
MTTIHIKLKEVYVDHLLAIISNHQEIQIDDIAIEGLTKADNAVQKTQKKQKLMRIARECANLPTLDSYSPDQILGYEQSDFGLWGNE